jgi:hypothetical protein
MPRVCLYVLALFQPAHCIVWLKNLTASSVSRETFKVNLSLFPKATRGLQPISYKGLLVRTPLHAIV